MSASGQKRTLKRICPMSALPPKADIRESTDMSAKCQKATYACKPSRNFDSQYFDDERKRSLTHNSIESPILR
jgi:hypothetical protein